VTFNDGIEVIAKPTDRQPTTAAAWPVRPSPKFGDSSTDSEGNQWRHLPPGPVPVDTILTIFS
jgi:hypothetical protein